MTNREASCSCGQLSVGCRGEPDIVSNCHCLACQKRTGSIFGVAAFYNRSNVEISGSSTSYRRKSERGFGVTSHFCPTCGSTVYWEREEPADIVGVAVGCFTDPSFPAPKRAVWTQSMHHWVLLPDGIARVAQQPAAGGPSNPAGPADADR